MEDVLARARALGYYVLLDLMRADVALNAEAMAKTIPLFAWMKSRSSFFPTSAKDSAPKRTAFNMRTTSISGTAQQAFSFLQSLWPDGDMPTLRRKGLLRIGQSK